MSKRCKCGCAQPVIRPSLVCLRGLSRQEASPETDSGDWHHLAGPAAEFDRHELVAGCEPRSDQ